MKKLIFIILLLTAQAFSQGNTTKVRAATSLPATCNAGDAINAADEIALVSGGNTNLYICKQTNTWQQVGGAVTFDQVGAGSNLNVLTVGNAGSLKPANLGQIAGNQAWLQPGLSVTTIDSSQTGGTIGSGQLQAWQYTLNSALGETLPSILQVAINGTAGCVSGGTCSFSVHAPTIPSGYTGYTVYWCDQSGGSGCTAPVKVLACANILTACSLTNPTLNSGVALPTVNTAVIAPPNVQATNGPAGFIPQWYFPKTDGNYYPWLGVEWNSCDSVNGPPLPCGTPMFTHRTWFSDQQSATVGGKNAFVLIDHNAGVGTVTTNQDRSLWVNWANPANDAATRYGAEGIQAELDWNCNGCSTNGSPDAEVTAVSAQVTTVGASTSWTTTGYGTNAVQGRFFRGGAGTDTNGMSAVYGNFGNTNTTAPAGSIMAGLRTNWASTASCPNCKGVGINMEPPANHNFGFIYGIFAHGSGFTPTANSDWFIDNQNVHNWNSLMNGVVGLTGIDNTDGGEGTTLPINASVNDTGSLTVSQIASGTGGISTVTCSGGASTYQYELVYNDGNGGSVPGVALNTTSATCTNPLTSGNPATLIALSTTLSVFRQAKSIDVYRVGGPMATGKVGSLTCLNNLPVFGCNSFVDTGIAPTTALPTANTTGGVTIGGDLTLGTSKGQHVNTQAANNDFAGTCTAAAATTCTVTFTRAYTSAPICTATDATNITTLKVTPSTGTLIITTVGSTSDVFDYICVGNPN